MVAQEAKWAQTRGSVRREGAASSLPISTCHAPVSAAAPERGKSSRSRAGGMRGLICLIRTSSVWLMAFVAMVCSIPEFGGTVLFQR